MNVPLTPEQSSAVHALQCRARARGVPCELHFTLDWKVMVLLDGREFATIDDASDHLDEVAA